MSITLSVLSGALLLAAAVALWAALKARRRALEKYRTIEWARSQMVRGVTLLGSADADDILSGLQIIRALGVGLDQRTMKRVTELTSHSDPRVVAQAQSALISTSRRVTSSA
jgi:hypothetical protein